MIKNIISLFLLILTTTLINLPRLHNQTNKIDSVKLKIEQPKLSPIKALQNDIESLIQNPDLSSAFIGISIFSIETGEFIFKKNDNKNFIPASNLKLFTTATALDVLGPEFRYTTKMYLDGVIHSNGEFYGDIIIRGSGDPTFSNYFNDDPLDILENFVHNLDSLGIRSIRGNIIGDDRYFDDFYYAEGWSWDDLSYPWAAQVNAISICDNKIDVQITPSDKIGEPARYVMVPENSYIQIINNVRTTYISDLTEIFSNRDFNSNIVEIVGKIAIDTSKQKEVYTHSIAIYNPTRFFLNLFKESLIKHNIKFRGALLDIEDWNEEPDYYNYRLIFDYESPPLFEIIRTINKMSHNLQSDMLLKTIGKEVTGKGSFEDGASQIKKFVVKAGINPDKINIVDGSGLSRYNLISPSYIVNLLTFMYKSNYKDFYLSSLAEPGKRGTLAQRMMRSRAELNVKAKTGTLENVSNLSGFVTTRDHETLVFSIMMMNLNSPLSTAQNIQDLICMRLASFTRKRE